MSDLHVMDNKFLVRFIAMRAVINSVSGWGGGGGGGGGRSPVLRHVAIKVK